MEFSTAELFFQQQILRTVKTIYQKQLEFIQKKGYLQHPHLDPDTITSISREIDEALEPLLNSTGDDFSFHLNNFEATLTTFDTAFQTIADFLNQK